MSREQSIKSLLTSSDDPKARLNIVITAAIVGVVLGGGVIAGTVYAYAQGYKKGIEVATLGHDAKEATQVY